MDFALLNYFRIRTLANKKDREEIVQRIDLLQNVPKPFLCSMTSQQVVVHMADIMRVATGNKKITTTNRTQRILHWIFTLPIIGRLTSQWLPWPPGVPTHPEFMDTTGGTKLSTFYEDRSNLITLVYRVGELNDKQPIPEHPVFGKLTTAQWQRLMWKHVNHHLWQFGI